MRKYTHAYNDVTAGAVSITVVPSGYVYLHWLPYKNFKSDKLTFFLPYFFNSHLL